MIVEILTIIDVLLVGSLFLFGYCPSCQRFKRRVLFSRVWDNTGRSMTLEPEWICKYCRIADKLMETDKYWDA